MDRGDLVPDEVIIGMIVERARGRGGRRRLHPRRLPAHRAAGRGARRGAASELGRGLTAALLIDVPDEEVVRRLGGRRTCAKNGHIFHVDFDPPKNEGVCDIDGSRLHRPRRRQARGDPAPARAPTDEKTEPLIAYYDGTRRRCARVDGRAAARRGRDRIRALLATLQDGRRRSEAHVPMIIRKTPEQIEKMAAAGEILVRCLKMLAPERPAGRRRRADLDRAAEKFIRSQGGEPAFKGYRGFPGSICASPNSMVVHGIPGRLRARARRHHLDRRRRDARRLGRRRRDHGPDRPVAEPRPAAAEDDPGLALRGHRRGAGRQPPRRRLARGPGAGRAGRLLGDPHASSATGSAATCTRTRRSRTSASPAGVRCSRRAWCFAIEPMVNAGAPDGPDGRRQLGRLLRGRLARRPLRVHGRGHRGGPADPHPLARRLSPRGA